MNTITIELCKEDRQRLDELIGLAGWITGALKDLAAAAPTASQEPLPPSMMDAAFQQFLAKQEQEARLQAAAATLGTHPADAPTAHLEPPKITQKELDQFAVVDEAYQAAIAAATPEVKPVSLAEFQKAVTQAVAKGPKQKEAAKGIINKYAASVSAVPEEKRAEVMAELAKI